VVRCLHWSDVCIGQMSACGQKSALVKCLHVVRCLHWSEVCMWSDVCIGQMSACGQMSA